MFYSSFKILHLAIFGSIGILANTTYSQSNDADAKVQKRMQRIQVVDPDGKPVADATFTPFGLNTSYFWPVKDMGEAIPCVSNSVGLLEVEYPERIGGERFTETIDGTLTHDNFVSIVERVPIQVDGESHVVLKPGIRVRLDAVNEDGNPIQHRFGVLVGGNRSPARWQEPSVGSVESKSMAPGVHQALLALVKHDGATLFSDMINIVVTEDSRAIGLQFSDIELSPGVRISGKLDKRVSRPVRDGYVMAHQFASYIPKARESGLEMVCWRDWTKLEEDGSFEFASMPRTGRVQLIAVCDGWTSAAHKKWTWQGLTRSSFIEGQCFNVDEKDLEVELKMEQAMKLHVSVLDGNGDPISNAKVGFSPNQLWKDWGSQILGSRQSTHDIIRKQLEPRCSIPNVRESWSRYSADTDEHGNAVFMDLPESSQHFYIGAKGFVPLETRLELSNRSKVKRIKVDGKIHYETTISLEPEN
jgi:hypothetical protein